MADRECVQAPDRCPLKVTLCGYCMRQPKATLATVLITSAFVLASCGKSDPELEKQGSRSSSAVENHADNILNSGSAAGRQQLATAIEAAGQLDVSEIDQELERIRQDLIIEHYFQSVYEDAVDDAAVQAHYQDNAEDFQITRVKLAHVLLRLPTEASDEEQLAIATRAQEVSAKLHSGEEFADVAKALSEDEDSALNGGELGWVADGAIDQNVMQVATALDVGEVSTPVKTRYGIHVVKKLAATEQVQRPLSEVRASIRQALRAKAKEVALKQLASAK